jgi:hypothetical protein
MSSRALAAARAKRAGDQTHQISGNRPITSIHSQSAFVQQYQAQPTNVRIARQQPSSRNIQQPPQNIQQNQNSNQNSLPFSKLSISDAIGLITLRLGRVEQWIIDTDSEEQSTSKTASIPENHKLIDNSVLATILNRLDTLEKTPQSSGMSEETQKRITDDLTKHTLELAKYNEQIFKMNRDLVETKDLLKTFMLKHDQFASETLQSLADYEVALSELETRLNTNELSELNNTNEQLDIDLNIIKEEQNDSQTKSIDLTNLT